MIVHPAHITLLLGGYNGYAVLAQDRVATRNSD